MEPIAADVREENYQEVMKVTRIGAVADFLLTVAKLGVGILSNSQALIAEGLHSAADLLFDIVAMVGVKMGRKDADEDHPYGHGKFETLATLILALILFWVAIEIIMGAAERIQDVEKLTAPGSIALWVAAASMIVKELLFHYTVHIGRKVGSQITIANAWHHRSDAIASFAALVGIAGAIMGWPIADPIAAICVAFFVGKVGVEIAIDAVRGLTDSVEAIEGEIWEAIQGVIRENPEVKSAHMIRARRLGQDIFVDAHVMVDSYMSVSEGHQIAHQIQDTIKAKVPDVLDMNIHIDTENDHISGRLPLYRDRNELLETLKQPDIMKSPWNSIQAITPHFNFQGIVLDMDLNTDDNMTVGQLRTASQTLSKQLLENNKDIVNVRTRVFLSEMMLTDEGKPFLPPHS
jgi:cation diffusion facilitator family transporter